MSQSAVQNQVEDVAIKTNSVSNTIDHWTCITERICIGRWVCHNNQIMIIISSVMVFGVSALQHLSVFAVVLPPPLFITNAIKNKNKTSSPSSPCHFCSGARAIYFHATVFGRHFPVRCDGLWPARIGSVCDGLWPARIRDCILLRCDGLWLARFDLFCIH